MCHAAAYAFSALRRVRRLRGVMAAKLICTERWRLTVAYIFHLDHRATQVCKSSTHRSVHEPTSRLWLCIVCVWVKKIINHLYSKAKREGDVGRRILYADLQNEWWAYSSVLSVYSTMRMRVRSARSSACISTHTPSICPVSTPISVACNFCWWSQCARRTLVVASR